MNLNGVVETVPRHILLVETVVSLPPLSFGGTKTDTRRAARQRCPRDVAHRALDGKSRILFLQLPQPENAVDAARENVPLAAVCLRWALGRSPERRHWRVIAHPPGADGWDDRRLAGWIGRVRPDVLAVTLYLWNVERTLDLLARVRRERPEVRVVAGGPEVVSDHPFLFKRGVIDAAVTGEGEPAFPFVLGGLRRGFRPALPGVGWKGAGRRLAWTRHAVHAENAALTLPPPAFACNRPDERGMAYLETGRGCALRCTFCCYNQRRRKAGYLGAAAVIRRAAVLTRRGARDIRIIDPTFNANPAFEDIVRGLAELNRNRRVRFFAELRGDTVTREQAVLLARANFTEIEIGVQSRDVAVLRAVRRPTNMAALDAGVRFLSKAGIALTLDIMAGLPGQTRRDVLRSARWAAEVPGARVQMLQTLLLPGTELRRTAGKLGLLAQRFPPYRVLRTPQMSGEDLAAAERHVRRLTGEAPDVPTHRFVGASLPDLFPERMTLDVEAWHGEVIPGSEIRRALILKGSELFARRDAVVRIVRQAIREEPHVLWQFVLAPEHEEPLDLLELATEAIGRFSPHFLDRMVFQPEGSRHVARRVFVLQKHGRQYDAAWVRAAGEYLEFHYW